MVSENPSNPYKRLLEIYFNNVLSFKWHVCILLEKALKVANALRSLSNTIRRISPRLLRQAALDCVFIIVHFGSEAWWPGRKTLSTQGRSVSIRVEPHLSLICTVFLKCARAILPVFPTTPTPALFREAGLFSPELELDRRSHQAILRAHSLDPRHPLLQRIGRIKKKNS